MLRIIKNRQDIWIRQSEMRQHLSAFATIFIVLLVVYSIPFMLKRSHNPILQRSGLSHVIEPGLISGQNTIDPNDGFTAQALGRRAAISWIDGDVPYWNHYEGVGMPLAAGMQSAAFFPLTILYRLHNGFIVIHFVLQLIAGVFTYLFLKKLKLENIFAITGGILFSIGGSFAWLANAPFNTIAFLPMMMLGFEYAFSSAKAGKRRGWLIIALSLSLSLYAGFPETAFINAIFAYGWGLIRLFELNKNARKLFVKKVVTASVVGMLCSAPILVAFLFYLPETITGGHSGGGYAFLALPISTLPALVLPYIFGPIFGVSDVGVGYPIMWFWSNVGGYLTSTLVLMALIGFFSKHPLSRRLYLGSVILIIILKIYGFRPVAILINLIPGMNQVAFYRYSIAVLSFAIVMLVVYGLESLYKAEITRKKVNILTTLVVAVIVGLGIFSLRLVNLLDNYSSAKEWALISVCWALSIILIPIFIYFRPYIRIICITSLIVFDTFIMFVVPFFSLPKMSQIDYEPVLYLQKNIGLNRFYTLGPIAPNYGSYFGIASVNINDLPIPKKWADHIPEKLDSNATALVFTGYSRVDSSGPTPIEEFGKNIREFENVGVRFIVTSRGQLNADFVRKHSLESVFINSSFEIFKLPHTKNYFESFPACLHTNESRNSLEVTCPTEAILVRRELSMPGWHATINNQKIQLGTDEDIFQSIHLPSGHSKIKFHYAPPYIEYGYAALSIGVLLIISSYLPRGTVRLK